MPPKRRAPFKAKARGFPDRRQKAADEADTKGSVRQSSRPRVPSAVMSDPGEDSSPTKPAKPAAPPVIVDFSKLGMATLERYKRHYRLKTRQVTRPCLLDWHPLGYRRANWLTILPSVIPRATERNKT